MGSSSPEEAHEEEKLVQMVRDFIEPDDHEAMTPTISNPSSQTTPDHLHDTACFTLEGIIGDMTKTEMEVYNRVLILFKYHVKNINMGNERSSTSTSVKRRLMMWLRMDGYDASLCKSSCDHIATFGRLGGDYDYIDIMMMEDKSGSSTPQIQRLIVDTDFKSQFELARPTLAYCQLFNTLPSIFVGSEQKLCKIISLLCTAAKQSLKERGLHIPPWRKASYMRSKWLSNCCQRVSHFGFSIISSSTTEEGISMVIKQAAAKGDIGSSEASSNWTPPEVKPRIRRDLGDGGAPGSCLSSQFSRLGINSCS